jgi:hypothetical protein
MRSAGSVNEGFWIQVQVRSTGNATCVSASGGALQRGRLWTRFPAMQPPPAQALPPTTLPAVASMPSTGPIDPLAKFVWHTSSTRKCRRCQSARPPCWRDVRGCLRILTGDKSAATDGTAVKPDDVIGINSTRGLRRTALDHSLRTNWSPRSRPGFPPNDHIDRPRQTDAR